jgi:hypothetical protein
MLYVDEHNRIGTQRSLADLVASTVATDKPDADKDDR